MLHAAAQCCIPATTTARGTKAGTFYQAKKKTATAASRQQAGDRRRLLPLPLPLAVGWHIISSHCLPKC